MYKVKTRFITVKQVLDFVERAGKSKEKVTALKPLTQYCVDAKSIMGLFSIDPSNEIVIESNDNDVIEWLFIENAQYTYYV